ncbi:MAG TPA: hypothetical protein VLA36_02405, partial [Longimicrobiales bacterium]|nr:hypothetical protein [Longimicrobiales bacterium]
LRKQLSDGWLNVLEDKLEELAALTSGLEGAALARAIESAAVTKKLDEIVSTFWNMWRSPLFSATAEFEVVVDLERRATKYMEIMVQRTLRFLLKPVIRALGVYPYASLDRGNYSRKIRMLREALERAKEILRLYAQARTVSEFNAALKERERLIGEFQTMIRVS